MPAGTTDPVVLFDERQTARLAGVTVGRLRSWHRTRLFSPQNRRTNPEADVPLYDFRDLVGLRVMVKLRRDNHLSLQCLRAITAHLRKWADQPWGRLTLHLAGTELVFEDPITGILTSACPLGQTVHPQIVRLKEIADDTRQAIIEYRQRKPGKIGRSRNVQRNKSVIAGTRITTATIWSLYKEGFSSQQIRREFPSLSEQDVSAAIAHEKHSRAA